MACLTSRIGTGRRVATDVHIAVRVHRDPSIQIPVHTVGHQAIGVAQNDVGTRGRGRHIVGGFAAVADAFGSQRELHRADPAEKERPAGRIQSLCLVLTRDRPRAADVPPFAEKLRQVGIIRTLTQSLLRELHVLRFDRKRSWPPAGVKPDAPPLTSDRHIRQVKRLTHGSPGPQSWKALRYVAGRECDGKRQVAQYGFRRTQRLHGDAARERSLAIDAFEVVGPCVDAVVVEPTDLVAEHAAVEDAAVDHHALVPPGGEEDGRARAVHEVQVRRARSLVHAERQLELAALHLHEIELLVVDVDVPPGVLVVDEIVLNLVVEEIEQFAVDANTIARQVDVRAVIVARNGRVGVPEVRLHSGSKIDAGTPAKPEGRAIVPPEAPVAPLLRAFLWLLLRRAGGLDGLLRDGRPCE